MLNLEIVTASDKESLSYIESLYLDSFPPDERRPFEQIVAMLREDSVFVLRLLCDDGRRVGFISCWQPDLAYVEHFAVSPKKRGGGWDSCRRSLLCDASIHPSFGNERQKQESPGKNVICDA